MDLIEKKICKAVLSIKTPMNFLDTNEKMMINEFVKGNCDSFMSYSNIDKDTFDKMVQLKEYLSQNVDLNDVDNLIYFDLISLFISITKKYIK